jgi:hypothetical protein
MTLTSHNTLCAASASRALSPHTTTVTSPYLFAVTSYENVSFDLLLKPTCQTTLNFSIFPTAVEPRSYKISHITVISMPSQHLRPPRPPNHPPHHLPMRPRKIQIHTHPLHRLPLPHHHPLRLKSRHKAPPQLRHHPRRIRRLVLHKMQHRRQGLHLRVCEGEMLQKYKRLRWEDCEGQVTEGRYPSHVSRLSPDDRRVKLTPR